MHAPRPYGRFAEQAELSEEDAAFIAKAVRSVTNFKTVSGLESLKRTFTLPSGRKGAVFDMGGTLRAIVYEKHETPEFVPDGSATTYIPMLFSGAITKAQVLEGEGVGIKLTDQCRRRIAGYRDEGMPPKDVQLRRFVIKYLSEFSYFEPDYTGIYTFTQYTKLRPTWYSGAMAQVMQVIGGYGRQDLTKLPKDRIERAEFRVPEKYMRKIRRELGNKRLPGYTGFPDEKGQFKYRYAPNGNNAVAFDTSGAPWLLQINSRGVFAMPLPVVPASTTPAFRQFVMDKADTELEELLDRFGGMPTGETFPVRQNDFEAWRRAGVIVKVCDTADFYDFMPIYTACGWAFNSSGREGFNTCQEIREDGMRMVHAYKMSLRLVPAENRGMLKNTWEFDDDADQAAVTRYLSGLFRALGNDQKSLAIKYKVRRQPLSAILARAGGDGSKDVDYWDNLEATPIASHGGNVARVGSGPVYWPHPAPTSQGRLKFPELRARGTESFLFPLQGYHGPAVRCDTVMFGCYVNDELQVIKYFYDEREFYRDVQSTFEPVMIVGSWEQVITSGATGLSGHFYTTADDRRSEVSPSVTRTTLVGTDMGYGTPQYKTPVALMRVGSISRSRYYKHTETIKVKNNESHDMAACVPVFARDFIHYAYLYNSGSTEEKVQTSQHGMADPNSYQLWTHDSIFHYLFTTNNGNVGYPYPKDGTPVYADTHVYTPTEYSDFADGGNWFNVPPYKDVTGVCGPYTSRSSTIHAGGVTIGGTPPGFEPFSSQSSTPSQSSGYLSGCGNGIGRVVVHNEVPHSWYFSFSPANSDFYFYQDMARIEIGARSYLSIFEKSAGDIRRRWGDTALSDHKSADHFIGVINE